MTPAEPAASGAEQNDSLDMLLAEVARPPSLRAPLLADAKQRAGITTLDIPAEAGFEELAPGTVIDGRYRVKHVLGQGGMGVVYAAENLQTGRKVALKCVLLHGRASPRAAQSALARFRREARAVARIRHPNVVDVYDAEGRSERPYLVMELLEGESLRARMQRSRLTWGEARPLLLALLDGLAAAHRAGVIHRDIKPDNIFLARATDSDVLVPKLLDFGIAAVRESSGEAAPGLTRTGTVLGTPSYMAPEQLTGRPVDVRTDVYGLGVTFYEMLSAELPFAARTAPELAVLQATRPAVPLREHCPELDINVASAVMRALAHDPAERHQNVEAFAAALVASDNVAPRRAFSVRHGLVLIALVGLGGYLGASQCSSVALPRAQFEPQPTPSRPVPKLRSPASVPPGAAPASREQASEAPRVSAPSSSAVSPPLPERSTRRARPPNVTPVAPRAPIVAPRAPADLSVDEF